jgi:protein-disulfide isomerase
MPRSKLRKADALWCGLLITMTCGSLLGDPRHAGGAGKAGVNELPAPASVVQYVRDRFEIPEKVKLEAEPLRRSSYPRFYQTVVTLDNGKQKQTNNVYITDDRLCFVMGNIFALTGESNAEIVRRLRDAAKVPPAAEVTVGSFKETPFLEFLKATLTVKAGSKAQTGELFVTRDRRTAVLGLVLPFRRDFVERLINTQDQPGVGPARARVTIVEYADLECPSCAYFHKFLEGEFLPKYGSKVRIIFKEFPLPSHHWSAAAAVANECAYLINPSKFLQYRTLIFGNQGTINAADVRERLLSLGDQAGLERAGLTTCLDSQATQGRIEACRREAENLGVNKTPTFCVNGRIVVGIPSTAGFCKIVDEALAGK